MMRRAALAAAVVAGGLAAVPSVATAADPNFVDPSFEKATTVAVEGRLIEIVRDDFENEKATSSYAVAVQDGPLVAVTFDDEDDVKTGDFSGELVVPAETAEDLDIAQGSTVEADSAEGEAAVEEASTSDEPTPVAAASIQPVAAAAAAVPSAHRAYVAVLNGATTGDGARASVNAAIDYWRAEAGSAITSFTIQEVRGFRYNVAGCGMANESTSTALWNQAAAQFSRTGASFNEGSTSGDHLIVLVPSSCSYVGLGTLGLNGLKSGGATIVNMSADTDAQTGVHELGHNFGLDHASLDEVDDYLDVYSPMGLGLSGRSPEFGSPVLGTLHREELGLTAAGEVTEVSMAPESEQTFVLNPRASSGGVRGLRMTLDLDGYDLPISVDYRAKVGRDATTFYGSPYSLDPALAYPSGVVVEAQPTWAVGSGPYTGAPGELFLFARRTGSVRTGAYAAGQTFSIGPELGMTVDSIAGGTATVTLSTKSYPAGTVSHAGISQVGQRVTATSVDFPSGSEMSYTWYAGPHNANDPGTVVGFGPSIVVPPAAVGRPLRAEATSTRAGYASPKPVYSTATRVAAGKLIAARPTITGKLKVKKTLTAAPGRWTPGTTFYYKWFANGKAISRSTTSRFFKLPKSAKGKRITVIVTGIKPGYAQAAVKSFSTGKVKK